MTDYFQFLEVPHRFLLDEVELRRKFIGNSKRLHPDRFTLDSEARQQEALHLSSINNRAYEVLSDFYLRMQHLLQLRGLLPQEGGNTELPKAFLLDMMDINEALMELEMDPNPQAVTDLTRQVTNLEQSFYQEVQKTIEHYDHAHTSPEELEPVKIFFLKKRYLLRIMEKLSIFANR
jgi:molecular chaperone HscB